MIPNLSVDHFYKIFKNSRMLFEAKYCNDLHYLG